MRRGRDETTARSQVAQKEHGRVLVVKPLNSFSHSRYLNRKRGDYVEGRRNRIQSSGGRKT